MTMNVDESEVMRMPHNDQHHTQTLVSSPLSAESVHKNMFVETSPLPDTSALLPSLQEEVYAKDYGHQKHEQNM